ncbi:MAG TPA: hypothetical protein VF800_18195 [Telluria sp.]|jgi:hypothetical protein
MVAGERSDTAPADAITAGGKLYIVPLHDASWPDDALVEFEFSGAEVISDAAGRDTER